MSITASARQHGHQYAFEVFIDDFNDFKAMECGPLGATIDTVVIREGGSREPIKESGLVDYKDITIKAAITTSVDVYNWFTQTVAGASGHQRTLTIRQLNRDGSTMKEWQVVGAILKDVDLGGWNNNTSEGTAESMVIAHEGVTQTI